MNGRQYNPLHWRTLKRRPEFAMGEEDPGNMANELRERQTITLGTDPQLPFLYDHAGSESQPTSSCTSASATSPTARRGTRSITLVVLFSTGRGCPVSWSGRFPVLDGDFRWKFRGALSPAENGSAHKFRRTKRTKTSAAPIRGLRRRSTGKSETA